ncbi:MAG: DUF2905 domain-containing protein [Thermoanaerobaculaceae bacterium]|nr:DUF2905 domain-containing protein [Thermoanaerobaculaceae bacterium]
MDKRFLGFVLISASFLLAVMGILLLLEKPFSFFGKLPGDIRIEKENFSIYIPITSMALISLILTLLLNIISRFFK